MYISAKPITRGASDISVNLRRGSSPQTLASMEISPPAMLFAFNDFDENVGSCNAREHDSESWNGDWAVHNVFTSDLSCEAQSQNLTKCCSSLSSCDELSSRRSSFSVIEDSTQQGMNPTCEESDKTKSARCSIVKDQCIDLCSRIKRLIETDVLSVPTATIAKSSMFHTKTTVRSTEPGAV
jgi:hypothetical protein